LRENKLKFYFLNKNQRASEKLLSREEKVHRLQSFCEAPVVMRSTKQRGKRARYVHNLQVRCGSRIGGKTEADVTILTSLFSSTPAALQQQADDQDAKNKSKHCCKTAKDARAILPKGILRA